MHCFPILATIAVGLASPARAAETPPNVLLLFVDNVGYGDLGCYGNRDAITPRIDQLAREGVRCLDFYTGSPSCSPSRGAILTGRHPERNGLNYQLSSDPDITDEGLPPGETILPAYLKPLGYACGAFGKWNIGFDPGQRPTEKGFDEFLGHRSGNIHYFKHLYHGQNDMRRGTDSRGPARAIQHRPVRRCGLRFHPSPCATSVVRVSAIQRHALRWRPQRGAW